MQMILFRLQQQMIWLIEKLRKWKKSIELKCLRVNSYWKEEGFEVLGEQRSGCGFKTRSVQCL